MKKNEKCHLFLTGEKGVGKSTYIKNYLAKNFSGKHIGGFYTIRSDKLFGDKFSVHIFDAAIPEGESFFSRENFLFECGRNDTGLYEKPGKTGDNVTEIFDTLGVEILSNSVKNNPDIIVMDEIGPHEFKAAKFKEEIFKILDADTPVIGVIQKVEEGMPGFSELEEIKNHPKVRVKVMEMKEVL